MAITPWLPGWTRVDLGPDGGPYDETAHPKGCIHTTEGSSLRGAENAYEDYPPHLGYDPINRTRHQYVALNRHSYALRGSESDDEFCIQIEIVGYAAQTQWWSQTIYNNIARDVIGPLEKAVGIPRRALRFYGDNEGIVLASASSPIRLTNTRFRNYKGWLGHQHIPSPDVHWDPGKFQIHKCFNYLSAQEDDMTPAELMAYRIGTDANDAFDDYSDNPGTLGHYFLGIRQRIDEVEPLLREVKSTLADVQAKLNSLDTE